MRRARAEFGWSDGRIGQKSWVRRVVAIVTTLAVAALLQACGGGGQSGAGGGPTDSGQVTIGMRDAVWRLRQLCA